MSPGSLPLLSRTPNEPAAGDHRWVTNLAGERVELLASRALLWPAESTLFVADVHLGKAAAFRAGGVPVPRGATAADLRRLSGMIASTGARRLVVLGDFLHSATGRVPALDSAFVEWRARHRHLDVLLVRGNHDAHAGDPPAAWGIAVVAEPHAVAPFLACHRPCRPTSGFALCGHVHPGVWISGEARESARLPCFVLGAKSALLPAFGSFTGMATIRPAADETIVVIAGQRLFRLPRAV
jgi:DNA ligase-associated metallophosphoesterase